MLLVPTHITSRVVDEPFRGILRRDKLLAIQKHLASVPVRIRRSSFNPTRTFSPPRFGKHSTPKRRAHLESCACARTRPGARRPRRGASLPRTRRRGRWRKARVPGPESSTRKTKGVSCGSGASANEATHGVGVRGRGTEQREAESKDWGVRDVHDVVKRRAGCLNFGVFENEAPDVDRKSVV